MKDDSEEELEGMGEVREQNVLVPSKTDLYTSISETSYFKVLSAVCTNHS